MDPDPALATNQDVDVAATGPPIPQTVADQVLPEVDPVDPTAEEVTTVVGASASSSSTSKSIQEYEEQIKRLQQTIQELHDEFGEKRAKFRNMFVQKEEELIEERNARQKLEAENKMILEDNQLVEKLKNDIQKSAKLRYKMEEDWGQLSEQFQLKLTYLEEQLSTYEVVVQELNNSYQQSLIEMEKDVRRLGMDRQEIQKNIERLEFENDNLQGKHVAHSEMLQNEYISLPNSVMELQEMVLGLKEELISVKIGKEQIEGEVKFLRDRVHMEEEEKKTIEESLMTEINDLRSQLNEQSIHNDRFNSEKNRLLKTITDLKSKVMSSDTYLQKISQLQKQNEELAKEKETVEKNLSELTVKTSTLRKELSNSEDLQRDLIALSKSLQMGLESIRQAETEVRWQHPDDIKQCNACKRQFSDAKEKVHCSHCGRIFCRAPCAARSVRRGARDYNVCDFCHTLLAHDSAPYFSTEPPHSPD